MGGDDLQLAPDIAQRPARAADLDWLIDLRLQTMSGYLKQSGQKLSPDDERERVLYRFDCVRIVERQGRPVGMIKVVRDDDPWELVQIQLHPDAQKQGLGGALILKVLNEASKADVVVSLHVLKVNPAKALYERLGFEVVGENEHSYHMRHPRAPARSDNRHREVRP